ncbi:MAG: DinB family protein [Saprospiraceae bacterium]|nr:DinB family protein [Saprospiraceae bacterium]
MNIESNRLIEDLIQDTKEYLNRVEQFKKLPAKILNWKADDKSWSILECIEHLNRYGNFYIPEISKRIENAPKNQSSSTFKSGVLGGYFAKTMLPREKLNKMKTFPSMNPLGSTLSADVLETFSVQQKQMLDLLNRARQVNLQKTKTDISISKFIKLRLGDTFRVVIYHNLRHLAQADRVLQEQQKMA